MRLRCRFGIHDWKFTGHRIFTGIGRLGRKMEKHERECQSCGIIHYKRIRSAGYIVSKEEKSGQNGENWG